MKHVTWMKIAQLIANEESKCISQRVGAVIVLNDKLVSTGYNGSPSGQPNCCDVNRDLVVDGKFQQWVSPEARVSHHHWSLMHEIHAEMNAILQSTPEKRLGATIYVTLQPCVNCSVMLAGSGIGTVVYLAEYDKTPPEATERLTLAGIKLYQLDMENNVLIPKN